MSVLMFCIQDPQDLNLLVAGSSLVTMSSRVRGDVGYGCASLPMHCPRMQGSGIRWYRHAVMGLGSSLDSFRRE